MLGMTKATTGRPESLRTPRRWVGGAVVLTLLLAACSTTSAGIDSSSPATSPTSPTSPTSSSATPAATSATVTKLMVLVIENRSFAQMSSQMPYVFGLAKQYGYASDFHAIRHPSLPNYLSIAGGSTFGVADDNPPSSHTAAGASVFGDAIRAGKTAKIYNEDMATPCDLVPGTGSNLYAVKHNAWAYFVDERSLCQKYDVSTAGLDADISAGRLPDAGEIIPNLCHDAHNLVAGCSLTQADTWLHTVIAKLLAGPDFTSGHLAVVVTADEDSYRDGNHILTTVFHPSQHHHVVSTPLTHDSLSRLFSQVLGTTPLRNAATAPDMAAAFGLPVAGS